MKLKLFPRRYHFYNKFHLELVGSFGATTLMLYAFDTTRRRFSLNRYAALRTLLHDSLLFILYTIITRRCITGKLYTGCKCLQSSYDTLSRNMRTVRTPLFVTSLFLSVWFAALKNCLKITYVRPRDFFTRDFLLNLCISPRVSPRFGSSMKIKPWNIAAKRNNVNHANLS